MCAGRLPGDRSASLLGMNHPGPLSPTPQSPPGVLRGVPTLTPALATTLIPGGGRKGDKPSPCSNQAGLCHLPAAPGAARHTGIGVPAWGGAPRSAPPSPTWYPPSRLRWGQRCPGPCGQPAGPRLEHRWVCGVQCPETAGPQGVPARGVTQRSLGTGMGHRDGARARPALGRARVNICPPHGRYPRRGWAGARLHRLLPSAPPQGRGAWSRGTRSGKQKTQQNPAPISAKAQPGWGQATAPGDSPKTQRRLPSPDHAGSSDREHGAPRAAPALHVPAYAASPQLASGCRRGPVTRPQPRGAHRAIASAECLQPCPGQECC